jgi:hypothetical protein
VRSEAEEQSGEQHDGFMHETLPLMNGQKECDGSRDIMPFPFGLPGSGTVLLYACDHVLLPMLNTAKKCIFRQGSSTPMLEIV